MLRLGNTAKRLLIVMTLLSGQIIFGTPVFGVTNASISISFDTSLSLSLNPGSFGSTSQSVSVTTDNYTGYTVFLTNSTNSTDLVNTNNNNYTIPTITLPQGSDSITQSQFTDGYGFSTNGTDYAPAPTSSNSLSIGNRSTAGTGSHSLYFGALPPASSASGSYTKTFVITAVANNPQYSINYNANAGTDTVTDMPSNQSTTTSGTGTVTLPNNVPTRSGYTFLGWDTNSAATTPTYPTGSANTITLEPTLANAINLYAIWQASSGPSTVIVVHPDNSETRTTTDEYGNIFVQEVDPNGVVTSYSIDTTASGGLAVTPGNNIDTGLVAFDGSTFTLHIVFKTTLSQNNGKYIVTALDLNNNYYNGFSLYVYNNNYLRTGIYKDRTRSSQTGLITPNAYIGLNSSSMTGERTFDVTITYDPLAVSNTYARINASLVGGNSGSQSNSRNSSNVPTSLPNATVIIGGNGINNSDDMNSLTIIEFEVIKNV